MAVSSEQSSFERSILINNFIMNREKNVLYMLVSTSGQSAGNIRYIKKSDSVTNGPNLIMNGTAATLGAGYIAYIDNDTYDIMYKTDSPNSTVGSGSGSFGLIKKDQTHVVVMSLSGDGGQTHGYLSGVIPCSFSGMTNYNGYIAFLGGGNYGAFWELHLLFNKTNGSYYNATIVENTVSSVKNLPIFAQHNIILQIKYIILGLMAIFYAVKRGANT